MINETNIEQMEIDDKTKSVVTEHYDEVCDLAKSIYAKNAAAINDQMRVNNAECAIKAAALFVDEWHKTFSGRSRCSEK